MFTLSKVILVVHNVFIKIKQISSFDLLLVGFDFAVLCIFVSEGSFSRFCYHKSSNSFIVVYFLLHIHIGLSWPNHVGN